MKRFWNEGLLATWISGCRDLAQTFSQPFIMAIVLALCPMAGRAQTPVRLVSANPFFVKTWTTESHIDFRVHVEKGGAPSDHEAFVLYDSPYSANQPWKRFSLTLEGDYGGHLTFTGRLQHICQTEFRVGCRMPDGSAFFEDREYKVTVWNQNYPPYTYSQYTLGVVGNTVGLLEARRTYTVVNGWPCVGLKGTIAVQKLIPANAGAITHDAVNVHLHMGGAWAVVPAHYVSTVNVEPGSPGHVQIWEFDAPWTLNPWITWQFWLPLEFDIQREWTVNGVTHTFDDDNFAQGYRMEFGLTDLIR